MQRTVFDQAGKQRLAATVDGAGDAGQPDKLGMLDGHPHLAVVGNDQRLEMMELAVGADLESVDVADQRIGECGGGGEERSQREQGLLHGRVG